MSYNYPGQPTQQPNQYSQFNAGQPPQSNQGQGMLGMNPQSYTQPGMPPQSFSQQLGGMPPTSYAQPGMVPPSYSQPPTSNYPSTSQPGMPMGGGQIPAPKTNVQFFSLQGGTPTPSTSQIAPPSNIGGPGSLSSAGPVGMMPPAAPFGGPPVSMAPPGSLGVGAQPFPSAPAPGGYPGVGMGGGPSMSGGMSQPGPMPVPGMGGVPGTTVPGVGGGGLGDPNLQPASQILPTLAETDFSIVCDPKFLKCTINKIPMSQATSSNSRIPLGAIVKPMADDVGTSNDIIDVVDFGSTGIVRCKRCRTYINPYVAWADNGRRWRCNICGMLNDVPTSYFSHLDSNGHRRDRDQRPELSKASVEFVAPGDYMVRPPQPPVYMFVIDVSSTSIQSGMLYNCVNAIKQSLDDLPGIPRTLIGFITFDSSIHFYNLKASLNAPQMLVVSDFSNDIILPLPEDLLVNLQESRKVVDQLLDILPTMFTTTTVNVSCTGPALQAAKKVISHIGGKMLLFQSSLPTLGEGTLKVRENPRILGTDKEHLLLNPEDAWYKNNAIDFSRLQIAVDTFLFSAQYTDLATVSMLSKLTAGSTFYYPGFYTKIDGKKFETDLHHVLTRSTAFEAVMRVRATKGLRITTFYGNHYVRGQDLLALPNCTSDSTFSLDFAYDEPNLLAQVITVQAALLYTSSCGERRIRIHTMVLPVTTSIPDVLDTIDIDAVVNILLKQAIEIAQKTGFENARNRVHQIAIEMLRGSRPMSASNPAVGYGASYGAPVAAASAATTESIHPTLQLIPLYAMSIQKSLSLRGGTDVRVDDRAYYHTLAHNMDTEESKAFVYPCLFSIHDMTEDVGLPSSNPEDELNAGALLAGPFNIKLPNILNLTQERFISQGIFLLENGVDMYLWVGRAVAPNIMHDLFGVYSLDQIDPSAFAVKSDENDSSSFASRVNAVIVALRQRRPGKYMKLHLIREGDGPAEAHLARYYVEDRAPFAGGQMGYAEYHNFVLRQVSGHT